MSELNNEVVEKNENVLVFRKPFEFEGDVFEKLDLSGLEDIKTIDLMEVNRILERTGFAGIVPENTMDYAVLVASRVTGLPVEFFEQLPGNEGVRLKRMVKSFLYA